MGIFDWIDETEWPKSKKVAAVKVSNDRKTRGLHSFTDLQWEAWSLGYDTKENEQ